MGTIKSSAVLPVEDHRLQDLTKDSIRRSYAQWKDYGSSEGDCRISTVGPEYEFAFVGLDLHFGDDPYLGWGFLSGLERNARQEMHFGLGEMINDKLFTMGDSYDEFLSVMRYPYERAWVTAIGHKREVLLIGGHADHDGSQSRVQGHRYLGMQKNTDGPNNQRNITFGKGFTYPLHGLADGGFGMQTSVNFAVPYEDVEYYYDAMSLVSTLLLGASASSPLLDSRLIYNKEGKPMHSLRPEIMIPSMRDVSFNYHGYEMGRMDVFPFSLSLNEKVDALMDMPLYEEMKRDGVREPLARYIAHNAYYPQHFVFEEDVEKDAVQPPLTWWLNGKIKYGEEIDPADGKQMILLEQRIIESMGSMEKNVSAMATFLGLTETVARLYKSGELTAIEGWKHQSNMYAMARHGVEGEAYLPGRKGKARDFFKSIGAKVLEDMKEYGYDAGTVGEMMDPALVHYGLAVGREGFVDVPREQTVAERIATSVIERGYGDSKVIPREIITEIYRPFVLNAS